MSHRDHAKDSRHGFDRRNIITFFVNFQTMARDIKQKSVANDKDELHASNLAIELDRARC